MWCVFLGVGLGLLLIGGYWEYWVFFSRRLRSYLVFVVSFLFIVVFRIKIFDLILGVTKRIGIFLFLYLGW